MKILAGITLLFTLFFSFQTKKENIVRMSQPIFSGEVQKTVAYTNPINDTIPGDTLFIHYNLNGNRVPKSGGCRPIMDMSGGMPGDLNYGVYVDEALELLKEIGYVGA